MRPFTPTGVTASVVPTATTQTVTLTSAGTPAGSIQRVTNASDTDVFITFGGAGVLATSHPLIAGQVQDFDVGAGITGCGVISTGTPAGGVYFTPGQVAD